jgi:hypothetical protein
MLSTIITFLNNQLHVGIHVSFPKAKVVLPRSTKKMSLFEKANLFGLNFEVLQSHQESRTISS